MITTQIIVKREKDFISIDCIGTWSVDTIANIEKRFLKVVKKSTKFILNLEKIEELDSSGAILLVLFKSQAFKVGSSVEFVSKSKNHKRLLRIIEDSVLNKSKIANKKRSYLYNLGKGSVDTFRAILEFIAFMGEFFVKLLVVFSFKNFRVKELFYFIYSAGIKAIPIISLTAFLVGVVIAYQTIVQLAKFGADIFVVDATAISIARELGPMITAIVVAGRSASSFTAEIGAMKLTQEIDAMKTMGFKPFYFLIIPRVIALVISLPILIFISDIVGIFGAMVATKAQIGLSFDIFIQRLYEVLSLKNYLIGIFKGPFFAVIVALIGSFHGLRVTQNTESIGEETTKSVVNTIFLVIVCDALFSVLFTRLGL
jgi:phospholipid/cholesterol/gamma-HCH transport system permease protein